MAAAWAGSHSVSPLILSAELPWRFEEATSAAVSEAAMASKSPSRSQWFIDWDGLLLEAIGEQTPCCVNSLVTW